MITREALSLEPGDERIVRVTYVQMDDGLDMGGTLIVSRANASWLAGELVACAERHGAYDAVDVQRGEDHVRVYASGSDQQPIVNVLVRRPESGLSGMMLTLPYAIELAGLLRAAAPG